MAPCSPAADYLRHSCTKALPAVPAGSSSDVQRQPQDRAPKGALERAGQRHERSFALLPGVRLG